MAGLTPDQRDGLKQAYDFARDTRDQADTLLWEVGAIVWGGQTLLLGFVLEAIDGKLGALILILVVAIIGIRMATFNEQIMETRAMVCNQMIEITTKIESDLEMPIKPQQELSNEYRAGTQRGLFSKLDSAFRVAWSMVIIVASCRILFISCGPLHSVFVRLGWM